MPVCALTAATIDRDEADDADDQPREDLGLGAAAEPERGTQAVQVERAEHRAAAEPGTGVALVADVVDDARFTRTSSGSPWWRRARRRGGAAGRGGAAAGRSSATTVQDAVVRGVVGRAARAAARPSRRTGSPMAVSAAASSSVPSLTSTASTSLASVIAEIRSARSSRPPSMAISESQIRSTSPSRCEQTTTEMPNSVPIRWISASIASRPAGSRPLVGSSSSSRSGSCTRAWASLTRCFMPVE